MIKIKITVYSAFLLLAAMGGSVVEASKPNIVFILADDLGYGDLGCYGHPYAKTPNIDRLAKSGTRFTRFYATGVTCQPSRVGFMTSRHPRSFERRVGDFGFGDRKTITELLRNNGYLQVSCSPSPRRLFRPWQQSPPNW